MLYPYFSMVCLFWLVNQYWCVVLCHLVVCDSLWPHGLLPPPGSSFHGDSPGNNTGLGCHAIPWRNPGDLPIPGIEPRSPTLQADSLLSEPPGKPSTDVFLLPEVHSLYDSLVAQWWRIHLPIQELWVWSLGQEDALGKEIEMHSSILA